MNDKVKVLAERIAEKFHGQEVTTGDEFGVGAVIIDEFNMDPGTVLVEHDIKFAASVIVEVRLDEEGEVYYQVTFQKPVETGLRRRRIQ